MRLPL